MSALTLPSRHSTQLATSSETKAMANWTSYVERLDFYFAARAKRKSTTDTQIN